MSKQEITFDRQADVLRVKPADERLDASVAEGFVERCRGELDGVGEIHVDLQDIRMLDSAGIGALARLYRLLGDGGRLSLVNPRPEVRTVLAMTRLDQVFRILPSTTGQA